MRGLLRWIFSLALIPVCAFAQTKDSLDKDIPINIERADSQWNRDVPVGASVSFTVNAFKGTNSLRVKPYAAYFAIARKRDNQPIATITGVVGVSSIAFNATNNNFPLAFKDWYSSVVIVSNNQRRLLGYGNLSAVSDSGVDGSGSMTMSRTVLMSLYTLTGSPNGWLSALNIDTNASSGDITSGTTSGGWLSGSAVSGAFNVELLTNTVKSKILAMYPWDTNRNDDVSASLTNGLISRAEARALTNGFWLTSEGIQYIANQGFVVVTITNGLWGRVEGKAYVGAQGYVTQTVTNGLISKTAAEDLTNGYIKVWVETDPVWCAVSGLYVRVAQVGTAAYSNAAAFAPASHSQPLSTITGAGTAAGSNATQFAAQGSYSAHTNKTLAGGAHGGEMDLLWQAWTGTAAKVTIGRRAQNTGSPGGVAIGEDSSSVDGGAAVGYYAVANYGGAVGEAAWAGDGGAIGNYAKAGAGFAGGFNAICSMYGSHANAAIDAVQLGTGSNTETGTVRFYTFKAMGVDGSTYHRGTNVETLLNLKASSSTVASSNAANTLALAARLLKAGDTATGELKGPDGTATNSYVTLAQLGSSIGGLSVLYASTNRTLVTGFYDARTFLPTHPVALVTNPTFATGEYLGQWISNTNLVSMIRAGIATITSRQRITTTGGGKSATVKPEIYITDAAGATVHELEVGQSITLTATLTDYTAEVDIPSNITVLSTERLAVKWKCVTAANAPTWEFQCGSGLIIAVRLPVVNSTAVLTDAPNDGVLYGRKSLAWSAAAEQSKVTATNAAVTLALAGKAARMNTTNFWRASYSGKVTGATDGSRRVTIGSTTASNALTQIQFRSYTGAPVFRVLKKLTTAQDLNANWSVVSGALTARSTNGVIVPTVNIASLWDLAVECTNAAAGCTGATVRVTGWQAP